MFIKVADRHIAPSSSVLGRVLLAAAALAVVLPVRMPWRETVRVVRENAFAIAIVGVLNSALPFWLLFWAETRIDSGLAAILQASAPLFTVLFASAFVPSERVAGLRLVGFLVGFAGVAVLVGGLGGGSVLAGVAVLGTAACYSGSALYAGRRLSHVPSLVTAFGAMLAATLVTLPAGLAQLPGQWPGWKEVGSVVVLGVVGSAFAYILYFTIIAKAGGSRAILVTYLVPGIAVLYGATILGEPLKATALGGLALILGGVALGTGAVRPFRRRASVPA